MLPRSWFLFLVTLGCGVAIGYFLGSPGVGSPQNAFSMTGENPHGTGNVIPVSATPGVSAGESDSKSIYSFSERLRGIASHPSPRWRKLQFARLAESVAIEDIPKAFEDLQGNTGGEKWDISRTLMARWAEVDPRSACEFGRRVKNNYMVAAAVGEWVAVDSAAALVWLKGLPPGSDRDRIIQEVTPALARVDPAQAFRLLKENPIENLGEYVISEVITRWAGKDISAAVAAVEGMEGYSRHGAMTALASGWAKSDLEAALAWALKTPDRNHSRRWVIDAAIRSAETVDIDALTAKARSLPDERDRSSVLASLVGLAAKRDPEKALALLGEVSGWDIRETATTSVIYAIMDTDIDRAAALVETLAGQGADQPIYEVVERLKFSDPARAATLSMKVSSNGTDPLGGVLTTWMRSSPEAALAWMEKTKLPYNSASRARESFTRWAAENPAAAVALVEERSSSENLKWAVNAAIQGIASKDPKTAAEMAQGKAAAIIDPGALGAIGSNWAQKDPKAGAEWVLGLSDNEQNRSAAWGFTNAWSAVDPKAAAVWIDRMQPGVLKDSATSAFSQVTARTEPETAMQWASTIQQEGARTMAMNQVLRTWAAREPDAVKKWVSSQPNLPRAVLNNLPE